MSYISKTCEVVVVNRGPTLRAVDAAGAAPGLGAIFGGGAMPPAVPVYRGCQRRN